MKYYAFFSLITVLFILFQGQSQSGGHGPGGGKKDDKVTGTQILLANMGTLLFW